MKRIFTVLGLFTILFSLASCQKEQGRIIATIAHYQGDEKVYMSGNSAFWNMSNDQIWVNNGTTAGSYPLRGIDNDDNYYEIVMGSTQTENIVLNALYPATAISQGATLSDENQISINLPNEQTYTVVDGKQVINAPMAAQAKVNASHGANLKFSNLCSLLKVKVHPNVYVISITVSQVPASEGGSNQPLAGTGTVTFGENGSTLTMDAGGSTSVTLNVNASREDGEYYVVIPPYNQSTKLVVTIHDNPQTIITRTQTTASAMPASKIAEVDCINNLYGLFSVSAKDTVSFARGNLTGSGTSFGFEETQFGLGDQYSSLPTLPSSITSEWFILNAQQWNYLLSRTDGNNVLQIRATITDDENNDHMGLILLPDNWSNLNCPVALNQTTTHNMNGLSVTQWNILERYGAVFLPSHQNAHNYYWTSTSGSYLMFGNNGNSGASVAGNTNGGSGDPYIRLAHYVVRGDQN